MRDRKWMKGRTFELNCLKEAKPGGVKDLS